MAEVKLLAQMVAKNSISWRGPLFSRAQPSQTASAPSADSSGRRNIDCIRSWQPLVERFSRRFPAQRLSRSGIEGRRNGGDLIGAVDAEVGAFREVLTQQPIGVLVSAALPWALRVAEVDLDTRIDLETIVLSRFDSLIPG